MGGVVATYRPPKRRLHLILGCEHVRCPRGFKLAQGTLQGIG